MKTIFSLFQAVVTSILKFSSKINYKSPKKTNHCLKFISIVKKNANIVIKNISLKSPKIISTISFHKTQKASKIILKKSFETPIKDIFVSNIILKDP